MSLIIRICSKKTPENPRVRLGLRGRQNLEEVVGCYKRVAVANRHFLEVEILRGDRWDFENDFLKEKR